MKSILRGLRSSPGFTVAAVLALGLGIGASAGVFSLLEGIVLRPLPYVEPGRLVMLWDGNQSKGLAHERLSPVNFLDYRQLRVFTDAAAWWQPQLTLTDETSGEPIRVSAVETTRNLFSVLGIRPMLGTGWPMDSTLFGPGSEIVISHRLWQTRYAGDPGIIGRTVRLNGSTFTILGVMPVGFGYPGETDLWQRLDWNLAQHSRGAHFMESVARLAPGVTLDAANRELAALGGRLEREYANTNSGWTVFSVPLDEEIAGVFRPALYALFGASGLLLLIACINVANLLLARAASRRREVAVRAAIGASRSRLVGLFLAEASVLAAIGTLLGLTIAVGSVRALLAWSPIAIPRAQDVGVNVPVLIFATVAAVVTALLFGLAPALLMSRAELQSALKDGTKGSGGQGGRLRSTLVVAEVALAVMLLSGAGLLIRSVGALLSERTGIDAASVVTADIQLSDGAYGDWERVNQFYESLASSLRERTEIAAVGASARLPLEAGWRLPYSIVGDAPTSGSDLLQAQTISVDEGYFAALRVPLVSGRVFSRTDDVRAPGVVVINEAFARQRFPGVNPLGKRITLRARNIGPLGRRNVVGDEHEIIGVVRNVKNTSLRESAEPAIYFSARQFPFRQMHLVVRGQGDPARLTSVIRDAVRRLDASLAAPTVTPMTRVLAASVDPPRFVMLLMSVFAALALTLAAVGIYGILSYTVAQRRQEMGIRLALGAQPGMVLRMILTEGLGLALFGCAIGALGAVIAARSLGSFLYDVAPWDPSTLGAVLAVVVGVSLVACVIPGRRAAAEDPSRALRSD